MYLIDSIGNNSQFSWRGDKEMLVAAGIDPDLATHAFLKDEPEKIFRASGEYDAIHGPGS